MFAPGGCILINGRWLRYQITRWVSDSDVTQTRMRLGCRVGIGGAAAHLFSPRTMRIRQGEYPEEPEQHYCWLDARAVLRQGRAHPSRPLPPCRARTAEPGRSGHGQRRDADLRQLRRRFHRGTLPQLFSPLCVTANPSLAGESQPSISSRAGARASIEGGGLPCGRETSYSGEQAFYLGDGTGRDGERVAGLEAFLFGARAHARGDVFRPLLGARGAHGRFFRWSLCCSSSPTGSGPSSATGAYVTSRL